MATPTYGIFLNGSYGVGKSSTLDHVGDLLAEHGKAFSLMDVDWSTALGRLRRTTLTMFIPRRSTWLPYGGTISGPALASPSWQVSWLLNTIGSDMSGFFALPVRAVRLVAGVAVTEARLRRRYTEHQDQALDWHLKRHADLSEQLALADLDELVIDTTTVIPDRLPQ